MERSELVNPPTRGADRWVLYPVGIWTALVLAIIPAARDVDVAAPFLLHVPGIAQEPAIDGEVDEPAWRGALATTGLLTPEGPARLPDSTVRLAWGRSGLFLLLYAADGDIRATVTTPDAPLWPEDAFELVFRPAGGSARVVWVSPNGTVTDGLVRSKGDLDVSWSSGVKVGHDLDGTPNDPRDEDEEWVVELGLPFESLGLRGARGERLGFTARRCDAPKGGSRRCGSWNGVLVLD